MEIRKYQFPIFEEKIIQSFSLTEGADVLSTGIDPAGKLCIWVLETPEKTTYVEVRSFLVIGTGKKMPAITRFRFIGTVKSKGFMWHVFEVT